MHTYITVLDVNNEFGTGWAGKSDPERCVLVANVWLTNKHLPNVTPIPYEWIIAGCEIAQEAAKGGLYQAKEVGLTSKTVKADTLSSSKTFSASYHTLSEAEQFAIDLLKPWLTANGHAMRIKKV